MAFIDSLFISNRVVIQNTEIEVGKKLNDSFIETKWEQITDIFRYVMGYSSEFSK